MRLDHFWALSARQSRAVRLRRGYIAQRHVQNNPLSWASSSLDRLMAGTPQTASVRCCNVGVSVHGPAIKVLAIAPLSCSTRCHAQRAKRIWLPRE